VEVDVSTLSFGAPTPVNLQDKAGKELPVKLYVCLMPPAPTKKTVFFVRHGESTWNAAQDGMLQEGQIQNIGEMMESRDNELSTDGIEQVMGLRNKVSAIADGTNTTATDGEKDFLTAQAIYMSPLTRAVQTGLIGAAPVVQSLRKARLMPNAREKRNLGGKDTSGSEVGEDIMLRVYECTAMSLPEADARALCTLDVDITEVQHKWWNENAENNATVTARMHDFLAQLRYSEEASILVAGHSHYFREIFHDFIHDDFAAANAELAKSLGKLKLMNAGVARVEMDFEKAPKIITNVELLFETKLVK